jgi:hypothetical protein
MKSRRKMLHAVVHHHLKPLNLNEGFVLQVLVQQQSPLRQQQLIAAGQNPIAQQQQPQQPPLVSGTPPAIMQNPQQLQTTAATGTWIPQQAENAASGMFTETSFSEIEIFTSLYRNSLQN